MNVKRVWKTGLAALMATSMVACSPKASDSASTSSDGSKKFVLGGSGPLTGDAAVYGQAVKNGAQIAVDEINAAGGKVAFDFVFEDDEASPDKAASAFNALLDKGMQVSLLTVTSGAGQAAAPLYNQENIFAITPSGSSPAIIYQDAENEKDAYGNVFQMCFTDPNLGIASAEYLSEHPDLGSKVAVIYRNDDNYSNGIYTKFIAAAKEYNLDVVDTEAFQDGTTDFSVYVKKAMDAGADVVFMPIYYQPASQILTEASKQGYTPKFFGADGMDGILTLKGFDTKLAEGLYMLTPFAADAKDEKTVNFVKKYKEAYGETPNQFAADAYDAVYALAQGLEAAGVSASDDVKTINEALKKQFTSMTFSGITGEDVTWKETGEVSKKPKAIVIQDGVYVSAE